VIILLYLVSICICTKEVDNAADGTKVIITPERDNTLTGITTVDGTRTTTPCVCDCQRECVLLHSIKELHFTRGLYTMSRREPSIPQLECIGGSAKDVFTPAVVRCVNNANWRCETTLDSSVELGTVIVSCEGYSGPYDPYVLRGSCALKYKLEYTSWPWYLLGKFQRFASIVLFTPIRWFGYTALSIFLVLCVVSILKRPSLIKESQQQRQERNGQTSLRENNEAGRDEATDRTWVRASENEYEVVKDGRNQDIWTGRLRSRGRDVPSPATPVGSANR